jgi:RNA polymerase-binding transcription factor DksA
LEKDHEKLFFKALEDISNSAKKGRHHDVIRNGLLLYLVSNVDGNDVQDSLPLVYVQTAIDKLLSNISGEKSRNRTIKHQCSFCGKEPPDVKLGAGPDAFICNECVSTFSDIFTESK